MGSGPGVRARRPALPAGAQNPGPRGKTGSPQTAQLSSGVSQAVTLLCWLLTSWDKLDQGEGDGRKGSTCETSQKATR